LNNSETKIGIICPLDDEYNACKEILGLKNESEVSGRIVSEKKEDNIEVYAVKAGVGKINCSSATQLVIDKLHTDFIIDAGVAGSLAEDVNINDVVCGKYIFEYDPNTGEILDKNTPFTWSTLCDSPHKKEFNEFINWVKETKKIIIKVGNIASGEEDVKSTELKQVLHQNFNAISCNWETSAILQTSKFNEVNRFSFRIIVDEADENMDDSFEANCKLALQEMFPVLKEFIFGGWVQKFC
jgi:adenosylhomocysteine nucleosidase